MGFDDGSIYEYRSYISVQQMKASHLCHGKMLISKKKHNNYMPQSKNLDFKKNVWINTKITIKSNRWVHMGEMSKKTPNMPFQDYLVSF